jgi:ATP-dependent Clp protease ATP-binding subunit ClpC
MLPKSSQRVTAVIRLANDIARGIDLEYVGTEHLLLAIFEEGTGMGAAILTARGVTPERLRGAVDQLVKKSLEETWVFGRLPGTPHFKNVMASAVEECQRLGGREVCTEHLLLAVARERGCVAHNALKLLGLQYEDIREDVRTRAGAPKTS